MSDTAVLEPAAPKLHARVEAFFSGVKDPAVRKEARTLHDILARATELPSQMWGPNIVGFGRYKYKTDSGRESEFVMAGFSPKERRMAIYMNPGYEELEEPLQRLGKFEREKSCILIRQLKDVDLKVLEEVIRLGTKRLMTRYTNWEA